MTTDALLLRYMGESADLSVLIDEHRRMRIILEGPRNSGDEAFALQEKLPTHVRYADDMLFLLKRIYEEEHAPGCDMKFAPLMECSCESRPLYNLLKMAGHRPSGCDHDDDQAAGA